MKTAAPVFTVMVMRYEEGAEEHEIFRQQVADLHLAGIVAVCNGMQAPPAPVKPKRVRKPRLVGVGAGT